MGISWCHDGKYLTASIAKWNGRIHGALFRLLLLLFSSRINRRRRRSVTQLCCCRHRLNDPPVINYSSPVVIDPSRDQKIKTGGHTVHREFPESTRYVGGILQRREKFFCAFCFIINYAPDSSDSRSASFSPSDKGGMLLKPSSLEAKWLPFHCWNCKLRRYADVTAD